jgi:hypothetical protein
MRSLLTAATATLLLVTAAGAQQRAGVLGEIRSDIVDVRQKMIALARAMPVSRLEWKPGTTDVRNVRQMYLHVAGDNYWMPLAIGIPVPPGTKITLNDMQANDVWVNRKITRDETIAELERSFAHLLKALDDTPDSRIEEKVRFYGQQMTLRQVWFLTAVHLHEHLGQAIAYARANDVIPPWSR